MKKVLLLSAVAAACCYGGEAVAIPNYSNIYATNKVLGEITVKGKVTDTDGKPLIGATIMVKGTNKGTISGTNGEFTIQAEEGSVLVISYIGYLTQEIAAAPSVSVTLEEGTALEEVIVSSTRAGIKTPVAYSNVNQEDIQRQNFGRDLPFLLAATPSITTTSDAGNGVGYTGIRVRGTDPSRINITANGIPVNDAESAQVYWVNMADFASSTKSLQIQRGVGTSTNGSGAFGATLNMQTESVGQDAYAQVDASAGSYGTHKETVRFSSGLLKDHWGVQGRVSNIHSDGYLDRARTDLQSYFVQAGYFSDKTVVKLVNFSGQEETYHAWDYTAKCDQEAYGRTFNSCGIMAYDDNYTPIAYYDKQIDKYTQQNFQLLVDKYINPFLTFNAGLHYTHGFGYYQEYKMGKTIAEYLLSTDWDEEADLIRKKAMDNDFFGAVGSLNFDNKNGLTATLGGGWNKYDGGHIGNVLWCEKVDLASDHEYYNNNGVKIDGNIYGKVNYQITKFLNAFVDLQYRHTSTKMNGPSDDFDNYEQIIYANTYRYDFFNPKAGIFADITDNDKVYASVAVAHKEPTRNDYEEHLGADIKAEQLTDYEIGYKRLGKVFSAGLNYYYMYYKNQFVLTGQLNEIGEMIASNDNSGRSYRAGIELEAAFQPVDWFRWDANATFSRNRNKHFTVTIDDPEVYDSDDSSTHGTEAVDLGSTPTAFSPEVIANNIFTFNKKGFSASIVTRFIGKQYLTNYGFEYYVCDGKREKYTPDGEKYSLMLDKFTTTDINLSYTFNFRVPKSLTLGVSIYNIFSTEYDNNGWGGCLVNTKSDGSLYAWNHYKKVGAWGAGFAPSAPVNFLVHASIRF